MDRNKFRSLLTYYLSCIDAEEASQLRVRENQENKTYIVLAMDGDEKLFSKNQSQLDVFLTDAHKKFLAQKSPDGETLVDLYYGFPILRDERDMLSPLFYVEAEVSLQVPNKACLLPKANKILVNRAYFLKRYNPEEIQSICDELEGEFGSFSARLKAAERYMSAISHNSAVTWLKKPILFRTNKSGARDGLRYDLGLLYGKSDCLSGKSALGNFVKGRLAVSRMQRQHTELPVLEGETLNQQQEDAVRKGLQAPLTVVTGPPGTGKTQVVTALIASAVCSNQTVLFASNNNMPVDGVYHRLGASMLSVGNWAMRLGNLEKTKECKAYINALIERLRTTAFLNADLEQEIDKFQKIEHEIQIVVAGIQRARALQGKIEETYNKEIAALQLLPKTWVQHFANEDPVVLNEQAVRNYQKHSAPGLLSWLWRRCFGEAIFKEKHNSLLAALFTENGSATDIKERFLIDEARENAVAKARETVKFVEQHQSWARYIVLRRALEQEIALCPSMVDLQKLKIDKSAVSQKLCDKKWLANIYNHQNDAQAAINNYFSDIDNYDKGRFERLKKSLEELKRFFPIWITTNQSVSKAIPLQEGLFDLVIIDEAGQCDIPSVIPLLYRAKRAVIIGDPQQFRHITSLKDDIEKDLVKRAGVGDMIGDWSYSGRSAFDRSFVATDCALFLKQHYRCHPDIIEFSNCSFYKGELVTQTIASQFHNKLPIEESGLIWCHVTGEVIRDKSGVWNPSEVAKVVELFSQWERQGLFAEPKLTFGVVTPFRRQVDAIMQAFAQTPWFNSLKTRFTVGTAHSFQGNECDVLIYSPVVAKHMTANHVKFASDQSELINVTVTRAKTLLCIVGDIDACQDLAPKSPLHQLASYAEKLRQRNRYPLNYVEQALANILDDLRLSYTPQFELGPYRLDFAVNTPSGDRYDIEVDGDIHWSADAVQHDQRRDAFVKNRGFKVIRFTASDVCRRPQMIKERLIHI